MFSLFLFMVMSSNLLFAATVEEVIVGEEGYELACKGGEEAECDCNPEVVCYWIVIVTTTERRYDSIYQPNLEKGWFDINIGSKTTNPSGTTTTTFISNPNTTQINASTIGQFVNILSNMP